MAFWERLPLAREKKRGSVVAEPQFTKEKKRQPLVKRAGERFSLVPLVKKIKDPG